MVRSASGLSRSADRQSSLSALGPGEPAHTADRSQRRAGGARSLRGLCLFASFTRLRAPACVRHIDGSAADGGCACRAPVAHASSHEAASRGRGVAGARGSSQRRPLWAWPVGGGVRGKPRSAFGYRASADALRRSSRSGRPFARPRRKASSRRLLALLSLGAACRANGGAGRAL